VLTPCPMLAAFRELSQVADRMHARILIVEDDLRARALLEKYLLRHGLMVVTASTGDEVNSIMSREEVSLVLLDVMLPGEDGLSICKRLSAQGTPVIMLTAKGETLDRIVGLELGADDYVVKPFDPRELLARICAVRRRHAKHIASDAEPSVYRFGPFELDTARRTLTRSGRLIALRKGAYAVLEALNRHAGRPLSRERLIQLARRGKPGIADRSIDIQISRLRRLIEADASQPCYIQTVWGYGYVFDPTGNEQ
jgi:two-component system, OmpR family, phosphate regulon response regulator OmpR